jgi:hypothetical protein
MAQTPEPQPRIDAPLSTQYNKGEQKYFIKYKPKPGAGAKPLK